MTWSHAVVLAMPLARFTSPSTSVGLGRSHERPLACEVYPIFPSLGTPNRCITASASPQEMRALLVQASAG